VNPADGRDTGADRGTRLLPHAGFHALQLFRTADREIVLVRFQALHQPPAARLNTLAKPLNIGLAIDELTLLRLRCQPRYRDREQSERARGCNSEFTHFDSLLGIAAPASDQVIRSDTSPARWLPEDSDHRERQPEHQVPNCKSA